MKTALPSKGTKKKKKRVLEGFKKMSDYEKKMRCLCNVIKI